jgi:REP element-mobilizing transposase RayT
MRRPPASLFLGLVPDAQRVHLILVPETASALTECLRETHRRYTCHVNRRESWHGYLGQGRFSSCVMDQAHLLAAGRYVERNPVRAGLRATPGDWPGQAREAISRIAPTG